MKSGQLPADLKIPDDVSGSKYVKENDEKMVSDGQNEVDVPNNAETQKNDEPAAMEQVSFYSLTGI